MSFLVKIESIKMGQGMVNIGNLHAPRELSEHNPDAVVYHEVKQDYENQDFFRFLGVQDSIRNSAFTFNELLSFMLAEIAKEPETKIFQDRTICWLISEKNDQLYMGVPQFWKHSDEHEWILSAWEFSLRRPRKGQLFLQNTARKAESCEPIEFAKTYAERINEESLV